tara:strand:+ start:1507 stop:2703 length:1197 start_codon:yes stop_codon:yes gene_type:complete
MMDDNLKKIQFKRLLKNYEAMLDDLEYLKEMSSTINSDFNSALAAKSRHDLFESKNIENLAEEEDKEVESPNRDPLFKKLFRKIVVKCHPDRMEAGLSIKKQAEYIDLYDQANKANDNDNMALLVTVAIKLEIELPEEYENHIDKISEERDNLAKEIENIQDSIAWIWYHADEDKKDSMLDQYIAHMESVLLKANKIKKLILGVGHPRTGTGYTHHIMNSWGLKVGHEKMKKDGIVAWQLTHLKGPWPFLDNVKEGDSYKFNCIIYNVRDPRFSIPSIVYTEANNEASVDFRKSILKINLDGNPVEAAIRSIIRFDQLINKRKPDFTFRIEDQSKDLFDFLKSKEIKIKWDDSEVNKKYNARDHENWESLSEHTKNVDQEHKNLINAFCKKHGYDSLF